MHSNRMKLTFFDDYWIDFRPGTERRWFQPELQCKPVSRLGYSSLVYDPVLQVYRIYYESSYDPNDERPRCLKMVESKDMLHFTQVYNRDGSDVLFHGDGGVHGASVMYDPQEKDPKRRYKFCGVTRFTAEDTPRLVNLAFSEDGVHWENHPELVANPHNSDTLNKLCYNPCADEYMLFHRSAYVDRRIALRTSKDLKNWSEPRILLHPSGVNSDDRFQNQNYAMSAKWFDGIFYGLLWYYRTDLHNMDFTKMFGVSEVGLTYSYDGKEFLYTGCDRLMQRPMAPNPGWAGFAPCDMCESADGKDYYLLVGGYCHAHGTHESNKVLRVKIREKGYSSALMVYKIRKDGFCGLESVCPGGLVITKGVELLKDDLTFNLRADCGSVRFGLMDDKGEYLEGFHLEDSVPFEFDEAVAVRPVWKQRKLSEALNQRVRIVLELNSAIVHSISATARPYIRMPQVSFSDPTGIFKR